jgi:hypothetical protein
MPQIFCTSLSAHLCKISNEAALLSIPIARYSKRRIILHKKRGYPFLQSSNFIFANYAGFIIDKKVKKAGQQTEEFHYNMI